MKDIVKCYFRNTPKQVADDLIMIAGNVGCLVIGEYEKIKPLISKLKKEITSSDYIFKDVVVCGKKVNLIF